MQRIIYFKHFLPVFIFLSSTASAQDIQSPGKPVMSISRNTQKTAGVVPRMVAASRYGLAYPPTRIVPIDSTCYIFTGPSSPLIASACDFTFYSGYWRPSWKYVYTYDAAGYLIQTDRLYWYVNPGSYQNDTRCVRTNNTAGYPARELWQTWDARNSTYINHAQYTYIYNGSNALIDKTWQQWDTTKRAWIDKEHNTYSRNAQDSLLQEIALTWYKPTNSWNNLKRTDNNWDASGLHKTGSALYWGTGASSWQLRETDSFTLDAAGRPVTDLRLSWNANKMMLDTAGRYSYSYDGSGNLTDLIYETWSATNQSFVNNSLRANAYDTFNQIVIANDYSWNAGSWTPANNYRYYYELYNSAAGVPTHGGSESLLVSPNPANGFADICLGWQDGENFTATLIDLQGRVQQRFSGIATKDFHIAINVAMLPAGNYLLSVKEANGRNVAQMLSIQH